MKSVLLHVYNDDGQLTRLAAAIALARAFGGRIQCVQVSPLSSYVVTEPFGGMYLVGQLYAELERQAHESKAAIEHALAETSIEHEWISLDGGVAQSLVSWSRLSDVIVLSQTHSNKDMKVPPVPIVSDVALHARMPVLVVPAQLSGGLDPAGPALIAWNGSPEAANALRAALALLARSSRVTIVTVDDEAGDFPAKSAIDYLARHGVPATAHRAQTDSATVTASLIASASALDASYVLMGAYGHSRFREAILGGVTRSMLDECPIPLLLAH